MENICSRMLIIKAGSKIITTDDNWNVCEFELLEDLEVHTTCENYYKVEKQGILPKGGTTI